MSFALNTYMSHAGIRREARPVSVVEKSQSQWLPFFPKAKKVREVALPARIQQPQLPSLHAAKDPNVFTCP